MRDGQIESEERPNRSRPPAQDAPTCHHLEVSPSMPPRSMT
jgi:hypothetical protein